MELSGSIEASLRAREALELFREKKMPVFHIRHISTRPGATFFLPGSEGANIHANVEPLANEAVIEKNYPNSFRGTPLREQLEKAGINRLVIAGMMTHMCVDATTRAAFDLGFECTLLHDACATSDLAFEAQTVPAVHVHLAFVSALSGIYAKATSTSEFISNLRRE